MGEFRETNKPNVHIFGPWRSGDPSVQNWNWKWNICDWIKSNQDLLNSGGLRRSVAIRSSKSFGKFKFHSHSSNTLFTLYDTGRHRQKTGLRRGIVGILRHTVTSSTMADEIVLRTRTTYDLIRTVSEKTLWSTTTNQLMDRSDGAYDGDERWFLRIITQLCVCVENCNSPSLSQKCVMQVSYKTEKICSMNWL